MNEWIRQLKYGSKFLLKGKLVLAVKIFCKEENPYDFERAFPAKRQNKLNKLKLGQNNLSIKQIQMPI